MIDRLVKEIKNKYWSFFLLIIYIIVFLVFVTLANIDKNDYCIIINGNKLKLEDGIKNERYISEEDLALNFSNNIYYDKISRKLVITSNEDILKIKSNDDYAILLDNKRWYDIYSIVEYFKYKWFDDKQNNIIYIYNENEIKASVISNRTFVYSFDGKVIGTENAKTSVNILLNKYAFNEDENFFVVKIQNDNANNYIGKIEKSKLNYENIEKTINVNDNKKIIMVTQTDKLSSNTDLNKINTLAVEMLRIGSEKNITEEQYLLTKDINKDIYAIVTNGYKQPSFDNSILSNVVSSDINKENIVNQILNFVNKLDIKGIIIDFKKYKISDRALIEQYVKELSATMHKNGKTVAIKMSDISDFDLNKIGEFVDYIIVQAYGKHTLASNVSGSHSTIQYVKNILNEFKSKIDVNKIILEIAPYSILWTEKAGSVINAETYSMHAASEYIKANKIHTIFDSNSGQNMINYTRGNITYKMWLEDELSISKKISLAQDLKGIAIYKSGYEDKNIYSMLDFKEE